MKPYKLYDLLLIIPSILIWVLMVLAKFAKYDDNVAFFLLSVLISFFVTFSIILIWFFKRRVIKESVLVTVLFLASSSPLTIYFFLEFLADAHLWAK